MASSTASSLTGAVGNASAPGRYDGGRVEHVAGGLAVDVRDPPARAPLAAAPGRPRPPSPPQASPASSARWRRTGSSSQNTQDRQPAGRSARLSRVSRASRLATIAGSMSRPLSGVSRRCLILGVHSRQEPVRCQQPVAPTSRPSGTRLDSYVDRYAARTQGMTASEIRALFSVASRPEVVSLAGGMPNISGLPLDVVGERDRRPGPRPRHRRAAVRLRPGRPAACASRSAT